MNFNSPYFFLIISVVLLFLIYKSSFHLNLSWNMRTCKTKYILTWSARHFAHFFIHCCPFFSWNYERYFHHHNVTAKWLPWEMHFRVTGSVVCHQFHQVTTPWHFSLWIVISFIRSCFAEKKLQAIKWKFTSHDWIICKIYHRIEMKLFVQTREGTTRIRRDGWKKGHWTLKQNYYFQKGGTIPSANEINTSLHFWFITTFY